MQQLRKAGIYGFLGGGTFLALLTLAASSLAGPKRKKVVQWAPIAWSRSLLAVAGVSAKTEGLERITPGQPYVLISNHRSHLDGPVLLAHLGIPFGFIVKRQLTRIPVFGQAMKLAGYVPVDRTGGSKDRQALDEAAEMVAAGSSILVFPEGTRSKTDDFLPFKKGGVVLAIKAQVPVLPISLSGTGQMLPKKGVNVRPGEALIRVHRPIPTAGLTLDDRDDLLEQVKACIVDGYIPGYDA